MGFARKELGPAVAPKEIEFVDNIPKTRSGKILRRLLKAKEFGLPEGDISTLEQSWKWFNKCTEKLIILKHLKSWYHLKK